MTKRQRIAYEEPSARVHDTLKGKFFEFVRLGSVLYSTILTVNK
jgi:hypothetical protein